jgi:glycine cleavage system H protein
MKKPNARHIRLRNGVWILEQGTLVTVGITARLAGYVGPMTYVALPEPGAVLHADDAACVVESSKAAMDIPEPLAGTVVEVNRHLEDDPGLLNRVAAEEGWLYRLRPNAKTVVSRGARQRRRT